jgi:NAD(P) transhydrogenase subunit alpha
VVINRTAGRWVDPKEGPVEPSRQPEELQIKSVGVLRETFPGERRVALTPTVVPSLIKAGLQVLVQEGAGMAAGFPDEAYRQKQADVLDQSGALDADVLLLVRMPGASAESDRDLLERLRPDQVLIGLGAPLWNPEGSARLAERKVVVFALELLPRITRAQSMDILSSQATVSGYKAAVLVAAHLGKMFPLLTTAAGTIAPARVLVIGAGVAGLQAIATARRLGAVVEAYDVRPAVREEVESLGARFVELPLQPGDAADASGYAKALGEGFYARQRELLTRVIRSSDAVITTALIPGKPAPVLITGEMVAEMLPGSMIVDLAAEQGGNCELTLPDASRDAGGVTILGPTNLPSTVAHHASQMFAKNASTFLLHLVQDGKLRVDMGDEITNRTLVSRGGQVVNPKVIEALRESIVREGKVA